jgi:hypothetical protein
VKRLLKVLLVTLIQEHKYTPDFEVVFTPKIFNFNLNLFDINGKHQTVLQKENKPFRMIIDVKSPTGNRFGKNQSAVTFVDRQVIVFEKHKHFVFKLLYKKLFKATWCPEGLYYNKACKKFIKLTKLGGMCCLLRDITEQEELKC